MNQQLNSVAEAMHWLIANQLGQPGLNELAQYMQLSPAHAQKRFQEMAGVTPKQFLMALTRESALERLRAGSTVLDAALESGLSGPGRLHDLLIATDAMTPGEARRRGSGVPMDFGTGQTPFGTGMVAWTPRGITFLAFLISMGSDGALQQLQSQWPDAALQRDDIAAQRKLDMIFANARNQPLKLWLRGSPFQLKVWDALTAIPPGTSVTYGQIAHAIEQPKANRAVGTAIGSNPIAWLIPCHRVINATGRLGGYRWGLDTKQAMIGVESASNH